MASKKKAETKSNAAPGKSGGGKGKGKGGASGEQGDAGNAKVKGAQKVKVRHILCSKHGKREEALAMLRETDEKGKAKYSFAEVADKFSEEKGAAKEYQKSDLQPEFAEVAFALPAAKGFKEDMSQYPFGLAKTVFGYHAILVEERK